MNSQKLTTDQIKHLTYLTRRGFKKFPTSPTKRCCSLSQFSISDVDLTVIINQITEQLQKNKEKQTQFELYLWNNRITSLGCKYLTKKQWTQIISLDLSRNIIDDRACRFFSQANWPRLRQLWLNGNQIRQMGCLQLVKANWDHLIQLSVVDNPIGEQGYIWLINRYPVDAVFCNNKYKTQKIDDKVIDSLS